MYSIKFKLTQFFSNEGNAEKLVQNLQDESIKNFTVGDLEISKDENGESKVFDNETGEEAPISVEDNKVKVGEVVTHSRDPYTHQHNSYGYPYENEEIDNWNKEVWEDMKKKYPTHKKHDASQENFSSLYDGGDWEVLSELEYLKNTEKYNDKETADYTADLIKFIKQKNKLGECVVFMPKENSDGTFKVPFDVVNKDIFYIIGTEPYKKTDPEFVKEFPHGFERSPENELLVEKKKMREAIDKAKDVFGTMMHSNTENFSSLLFSNEEVEKSSDPYNESEVETFASDPYGSSDSDHGYWEINMNDGGKGPVPAFKQHGSKSAIKKDLESKGYTNVTFKRLGDKEPNHHSNLETFATDSSKKVSWRVNYFNKNRKFESIVVEATNIQEVLSSPGLVGCEVISAVKEGSSKLMKDPKELLFSDLLFSNGKWEILPLSQYKGIPKYIEMLNKVAKAKGFSNPIIVEWNEDSDPDFSRIQELINSGDLIDLSYRSKDKDVEDARKIIPGNDASFIAESSKVRSKLNKLGYFSDLKITDELAKQYLIKNDEISDKSELAKALNISEEDLDKVAEYATKNVTKLMHSNTEETKVESTPDSQEPEEATVVNHADEGNKIEYKSPVEIAQESKADENKSLIDLAREQNQKLKLNN